MLSNTQAFNYLSLEGPCVWGAHGSLQIQEAALCAELFKCTGKLAWLAGWVSKKSHWTFQARKFPNLKYCISWDFPVIFAYNDYHGEATSTPSYPITANKLQHQGTVRHLPLPAQTTLNPNRKAAQQPGPWCPGPLHGPGEALGEKPTSPWTQRR